MVTLVDKIGSKLAFFPPDPPSYKVEQHGDGAREEYVQPTRRQACAHHQLLACRTVPYRLLCYLHNRALLGSGPHFASVESSSAEGGLKGCTPYAVV